MKHKLVGSKRAQILIEKYKNANCHADGIDDLYSFPPPGNVDYKTFNWTGWKTHCTPYVGGSMEIIHLGKVTKHAKDLDEYRPHFYIRMHHDVKDCSSSSPQNLYEGDENCNGLGVDSYIGRRIDEGVLHLLSVASHEKYVSAVALMLCIVTSILNTNVL